MADSIWPWPLVANERRQHPVPTLQHLLGEHGHPLAVDGIFGSRTEAAIRAFQRARQLVVDGVVGPATWSALTVEVKQGAQGDAVRGVQEELRFHTSSTNPEEDLEIDGIFGPATDAAVREFQQALSGKIGGIAVDGIVGPITWRAMVSGMLANSIIIDGFTVTAAPGSTAPAPVFQPPLVAGGDLALVTDSAGVALQAGTGPLSAALRFRIHAMLRAVPGYRISEVWGSVTSGIVGADPNAGATASARTRVTLGGVAIGSTISTTDMAQDTVHIPTVDFPALHQCAGRPLALDIDVVLEAHRTRLEAEVLAQLDAVDLHFEVRPCP